MAADDFALTPTWVYPEEPEFHTIVTQTEGFKKDYQSVSSNAVTKFRLAFIGLSDANTKTLRDHYNARYGGYDEFSWLNANIPTYIKSLLGLTSEDLTGRWVQGSFRITPKATVYDAEITFERTVS